MTEKDCTTARSGSDAILSLLTDSWVWSRVFPIEGMLQSDINGGLGRGWGTRLHGYHTLITD